jgi:hypothetical protein
MSLLLHGLRDYYHQKDGGDHIQRHGEESYGCPPYSVDAARICKGHL